MSCSQAAGRTAHLVFGVLTAGGRALPRLPQTSHLQPQAPPLHLSRVQPLGENQDVLSQCGHYGLMHHGLDGVTNEALFDVEW